MWAAAGACDSDWRHPSSEMGESDREIDVCRATRDLDSARSRRSRPGGGRGLRSTIEATPGYVAGFHLRNLRPGKRSRSRSPRARLHSRRRGGSRPAPGHEWAGSTPTRWEYYSEVIESWDVWRPRRSQASGSPCTPRRATRRRPGSASSPRRPCSPSSGRSRKGRAAVWPPG